MGLGYPTKEEEKDIIRLNTGNPLEAIGPVVERGELDSIFAHLAAVSIHPDVMDYLVDIVSETRDREEYQLGVSPRGAIALYKACQAYAALNGRDYILPEDIKYLAPYVLNHRIIARGAANLAKALALIEDTAAVAVPLKICRNSHDGMSSCHRLSSQYHTLMLY